MRIYLLIDINAVILLNNKMSFFVYSMLEIIGDNDLDNLLVVGCLSDAVGGVHCNCWHKSIVEIAKFLNIRSCKESNLKKKTIFFF